ncbi:DUF5336 domain-containing protein [Gordonia phthalatica]|uniref:Uncharacterized protein n=1 Tax=Gordonia phthalatica TaxID=1136941 RepID=A0A0N9MMA4_9ACTN|nr:DUF5336 domain-containing protein [Gordonia phthalatica]ALG83843.1 hypothetical protein ACH46_04125 [Gordonia phthalatica]
MTNPQEPGHAERQNPTGPPGPESERWAAAPSWSDQTQAVPTYAAGPQTGFPQPPQGQPYGPGFGPMPVAPRPSFVSRLPRPALMALTASVAGIITFFMGFLGWITITDTIDRKAENWANELGDSVSIPAYLTPSLVLSPGWFFLLLGAVAVASAGLIAPKLRHFLPYLAFLAVVGWLGLFVCALGLPPFISLGAGAYVALIFGFLQAALLVVAAVLDGMDDRPSGPVQPGGQAPPAGPGFPPRLGF